MLYPYDLQSKHQSLGQKDEVLGFPRAFCNGLYFLTGDTFLKGWSETWGSWGGEGGAPVGSRSAVPNVDVLGLGRETLGFPGSTTAETS